jgi:hypothetical protein
VIRVDERESLSIDFEIEKAGQMSWLRGTPISATVLLVCVKDLSKTSGIVEQNGSDTIADNQNPPAAVPIRVLIETITARQL